MESSGQSILQFMIKAKFRRKDCQFCLLLVFLLICFDVSDHHSLTPSSQGSSSCGDVFCLHGSCVGGKCVCDRGWQGSACHRCGGRLKLDTPSGFITDGFTNYSTDLQCTWLIDSGSRDALIRMQLIEFETECSWDHLYVFDGDSVFAPLIAAYSGLLVKNGHSYQEVPEIVAHSGRAYLYFYSDAAYNMSGFNVSYTINGCPKNCSRNGVCENDVCICNGNWFGDACDIQVCPNDCKPHGDCDRRGKKCICHPSYTGADCSQKESQGSWKLLSGQREVSGRALHAAAVDGSFMYVTGGDFFHHHKKKDPPFMTKYKFLTGEWDTISSNGQTPGHRFGHTLTHYKRKLYLFGGIFLNGTVAGDLWTFDISDNTWTLKTPMNDHNRLPCLNYHCLPVETTGHSATLVDDRLIFIFGHNPVFGYLNIVQEYHITKETWSIIQGKGAVVKGGFGHSAAFDPVTRKIFVYAGYHSYGTDSVLVDLLYSYDPDKHFWQLRNPSHSPRYLHTAAIINGAMIVYGGNGHNATHNNGGDKCFSPQVLMYDIECDSWHTLQDPGTSLKRNMETGRYGHSMVLHDNSLYAFGGFNGLMLNSILKFTPGNSCLDLTSKSQCITSKPGIVCHWNSEKGICVPSSLMNHSSMSSRYSAMGFLSEDKCTDERRSSNFTDLCMKQSTCPSCLESTYNCLWCSDSCSFEKCRKPGIKGFSEPLRCEEDLFVTSNCDKLHNCHACHTEPHCGWQRDHKCYTFVKEVGNKTQKAIVNSELRPPCDIPCHQRKSCLNCSSGPSCMWCNSLQRCIESNAYAAIFPIGQCMEWTIHSQKCQNCSDIQTCDKCQQNPRCGWCDDGHKSGVGRCMEGAGEGPYDWNAIGPSLNQTKCPASQWFFSSCPSCQCNGHAMCSRDPSVCDSCSHLTEGSHCQECQSSYYGNPVNGGTCKPCSCNNHSYQCDRVTGKCYCTTKGIIGDNCDRCDEQNHYFGNPTEKGGSCFYNLTIDFQYTFNMSKLDDKYLNRINFMNVPMKSDVDVDFTVACSKSAIFTISIGSNSIPLRSMVDNLECTTTSYKQRFSHDEHLFGAENTTFYVNVYKFETPFVLQISFSQHRTLDLLQFFVTFSSCFLTLLIIAAILWKVKQKYDMYRRRQQMFLEMQNMASRPFAGILLHLENSDQSGNEAVISSKFKNNATPVAIEPCSTGKAAVFSLILRLPTGGSGSVPSGQTGLAIASALVSLSNDNHKTTKEEPPVNSCKQLSVTTKTSETDDPPAVL